MYLPTLLNVIFVHSTVSSGINAIACVVVEDILKPNFVWTEKVYTWISKGIITTSVSLIKGETPGHG